MERQYLVSSKNNYIDKLLKKKKINEASRIMKGNKYDPIFYPKEIHPESSPDISNDINLQLDEISNDLQALNDQISIAAFDIRNYMNVTLARLEHSKKSLIEELQRKQDAEILCKKYNFTQVLDLTGENFSGEFNNDNNIFSAKIIGHSKVKYEITSIDGNGYEGNKYVLTSDDSFLESFMDTSNRENINDGNNSTCYEYSRITIGQDEEKYCEHANKDTIEAKCILTIKADDYINCLRLISQNKKLVLNEVLISSDGLQYTQVLKESIDLNDLNKKTEINNYIPKSGLICFPSTKYVKLSLESCGYTGDKLGFEATSVEDDFKDTIKEKIITLKQLNKNHVFKFKTYNIDESTINNDNINIINLSKNVSIPFTHKYTNDTLLISGLNDFNHDDYMLTIKNLKTKNGKDSKNNYKIYFNIKDDQVIYYNPLYFVDTSQKININLNELDINKNFLTDDYVYVINSKNEIVNVNFELDNLSHILSFCPKDRYEYDSEYKLFISKDCRNLKDQNIKNTYCLKFKTVKKNILFLRESCLIPINSKLTKSFGYDIDLEKSKIYIIDSNNHIIDCKINNSDENITSLDIYTNNLEKDKNYLCICEHGHTNSGAILDNPIGFKFSTESEDIRYLPEEIYVEKDKEFNITLDCDLEKSYIQEYVYVLDQNYNKIKNIINYDGKVLNIKPPREGYSYLKDYYIVINKNILNKNLMPIGVTLIKHFKTTNKNIILKANKYFIQPNTNLKIEIPYKNYKCYLLNDSKRLNYTQQENGICIDFSSMYKYDSVYKLYIENSNELYLYNIYSSPLESEITYLNEKFFVPTNYKMKLNFNGILEKDFYNYIYVIDTEDFNKIDIDLFLSGTDLIIDFKNNLVFNHSYILVLDKNLKLDGLEINKYIINKINIASETYIREDNRIITNESAINLTYNFNIDSDSINNNVYIVNQNYEKIQCNIVYNNDTVKITPNEFNKSDKYTLVANVKLKNGIVTNKYLCYTIE